MKFNLGNNYLIIIFVKANFSKIAGNLANKKKTQLNDLRLVIFRVQPSVYGRNFLGWGCQIFGKKALVEFSLYY